MLTLLKMGDTVEIKDAPHYKRHVVTTCERERAEFGEIVTRAMEAAGVAQIGTPAPPAADEPWLVITTEAGGEPSHVLSVGQFVEVDGYGARQVEEVGENEYVLSPPRSRPAGPVVMAFACARRPRRRKPRG